MIHSQSKVTSGCLLALALFVSPQSFAEESGPGDAPLLPERVRLLLPACPAPLFNNPAVVESLRVELLEDGVAIGGGAADATSGLTAIISVDAPSCARPLVQVIVSRENGEAVRRETVDLSDRPVGDRARLLALALAEILRSTSLFPAVSESADLPERPSECIECPPQVDREALVREVVSRADEIVEESREDHRRMGLLIDIQLGARIYVAFNGMGFGGRLGVSFRPAASLPLRLGFDAGYRYGEGTDTLGSVRTHEGFGAITLVADGGWRLVRGELGLRLEAGWGWAEGIPLDSSVLGGGLDGFQLTPTARCTLRIALGSWAWLVADLEVGHVVVGLDVRAAERRVGGIGGPVLTTTIGVALGPRPPE